MKKMLSLLCAAGICILHTGGIPVSAEEPSSGKCGDNITWHYDADTASLTLTGTGAMYDYENWMIGTPSEHAPWQSLGFQRLTVSEGIETIGSFAFSACNSLSSVSLPDSLSRIGDHAFLYCYALKSFETSAAEIGESALSSCLSLETVKLKSGVESIGDSCFDTDIELSVIDIPETVTHIGWNAFRACTKWYQAQTDEFIIEGDGILCQYKGADSFVKIPETVKQIAAGAFLTAQDQQDGIWALPPLYSIEIPETVHSLPDHAFDGVTSVVTVTLPETLEHIGEKAFSGCTNLTNLKIPDSVTYIGSDAFEGTKWLNDLKSSKQEQIMVGEGLLLLMQGDQKIITIDDSVKTVCTSAILSKQILEVVFTEPDTIINPNAVTNKYAVIAGIPGSTAERYAQKEGMTFRDITAVPDGPDMTLDFKKDVWQFSNSSSYFGNTYYLSDSDRAHLEAAGADLSIIDKPWGGSCGGMATTVILVKNGIISPAQLQADAEHLSDVTLTDSVRSFINYYQCTQGRDDYEPQRNKIYRMIRLAENVPHGESPFLLTFSLSSGSHATVGYGIESGEWTFDEKKYDRRILIWDPNFPTEFRDDCCLYFDSETYAYCLPHYNVSVSANTVDSSGAIMTVSNDISTLNAYPYPFAAAERGDVNLDSSVTVADAVLLTRFLTAQATLSDVQMQAADLSGDSRITAADLTLLKRQLTAKAA